MATFYDLTAQLGANTIFTGSVLVNANSTSGQYVAVSDSSPSVSTGSWLGLANTWGASSLLAQTLTGSLSEGVWWGIDYSWGLYLIPTESFDRADVTSNQFPHPDQGLSPGDWNPFPIPEAPPEPVLPPRDLTRYRKSYSAARHQPVRIRLVKP